MNNVLMNTFVHNIILHERVYTKNVFILLLFFLEQEKEHMSRGQEMGLGGQREKERENAQQAPSMLSRKPDAGLNLMISRP